MMKNYISNLCYVAFTGQIQGGEYIHDNPVISVDDVTKFTRQYYKYIRKNASRIEAISDNSDLDPVAFVNQDNTYVVVVKAETGSSFDISGLPANTYGIKYTTSAEYDTDLSDITINAGEVLSTDIPQTGVITIYGISPITADPAILIRKNEYYIMPNPFNNNIFVTVKSHNIAGRQTVFLDLYDMLGRKIQTRYFLINNLSQIFTISTDNIPDGVYFYKFSDNKSTVLKTGKIIKTQ